MTAADRPPHLANGVRLGMYEQMLRIRLGGRGHRTALRRERDAVLTHLCIGQEAVPAGVSAHLGVKDLVFSGHRATATTSPRAAI